MGGCLVGCALGHKELLSELTIQNVVRSEYRVNIDVTLKEEEEEGEEKEEEGNMASMLLLDQQQEHF